MSAVEKGRTAANVPTPRPQSDLAVADVNTFFRILRFISSYPALAKLPGAAVAEESTTTANATTASLLTSSSPSTTTRVVVTPTPTVMGVSLSIANRIAVPSKLREPLEQYRRVATTAPVNQECLEAARQRVQATMQELSAALGDAATIAALSNDVFSHTEDELIESDSTSLADSSVADDFGPKFDSTKTRVSNIKEMQQIVPGLWCGPREIASNLQVLKKCNITHILCCYQSGHSFADDFMWCNIPAVDIPQFNIARYFDQAFEFIENAVVKQHGNVLVHCECAISRGPTIVAAYLMRKLCINSTSAIKLVRHSRYAATPNIGFRDQLYKFGLQLKVDEKEVSERVAAASVELNEAAAHINANNRMKSDATEDENRQ